VHSIKDDGRFLDAQYSKQEGSSDPITVVNWLVELATLTKGNIEGDIFVRKDGAVWN